MTRLFSVAPLCSIVLLALMAPAAAQISPSAAEIAAYRGLHAAAARGDAGEIERLVRAGTTIDAHDSHGRTPLHVAVFMGKQDAARTLLRLGADPNVLECDKLRDARGKYITIAMHRLDECRTLGINLDLLSQPRNLRIDRPLIGMPAGAMSHIHQMSPAENTAWILHKTDKILNSPPVSGTSRPSGEINCRRSRIALHPSKHSVGAPSSHAPLSRNRFKGRSTFFARASTSRR